jgi:iron-sulfur cluster assembly accessory protein
MDFLQQDIITLTPKAIQQVKDLMSDVDSNILGLRVGVNNKGCNGMSYVVEYAEHQKKFEEIIEQDGVKIFIDPAATMFLIGAVMDFEDNVFESKFTFTNPNETSRCGCGESFSV